MFIAPSEILYSDIWTIFLAGKLWNDLHRDLNADKVFVGVIFEHPPALDLDGRVARQDLIAMCKV